VTNDEVAHLIEIGAERAFRSDRLISQSLSRRLWCGQEADHFLLKVILR